MTTDLSPADATHRRRVLDAHAKHASELGAVLDGDQTWGWYDRSVSGRGTHDDRVAWVRTVSEQPQWADSIMWTGNVDANVLAGVPKPHVLAWTETKDEDRWFRTEVMTYVDQPVVSPTPELTALPDVDAAWLRRLRYALDQLGCIATDRVAKVQADVTQRLRQYFGDRIDPVVETWVASHCDLHWANLTTGGPGDGPVILDWEGWGLAPYGYDAATLYCHSLLVPEAASAVRHRFEDVLDRPDGRRSQLLVIARMLGRTEMGDYDDLVVPLHRLANRLLGR